MATASPSRTAVSAARLLYRDWSPPPWSTTTVVPISGSSLICSTVPALMASTLTPWAAARSRPLWVRQSPMVGSRDRTSRLKSRNTAPFTGQVNTSDTLSSPVSSGGCAACWTGSGSSGWITGSSAAGSGWTASCSGGSSRAGGASVSPCSGRVTDASPPAGSAMPVLSTAV